MPQRLVVDQTVLHDRLHDLRNLLAVISSSVHLLRDGPLSDQQAMLVHAADRSAMRGGEAVDRLLGRGKARSPAKIDLNSVIVDLQPVFVGLLGSRGRFEFDLCSNPLPLSADLDDLENVLLELVVNAGRAFGAGSNRQVTIRSRRVGNRAWLFVADNGRGATGIQRPSLHTANGHLHGLPRIARWLRGVHWHIHWRSAADKGTAVAIALPLRVSLRGDGRSTGSLEIGNDAPDRVAA
jgi:light-regulated signal transduction histidine kinase (bacteriophytochrome)